MSLEPRELVLPGSGATLRVKFVGPMLLNDIRKAAAKEAARQVGGKPTPPLHYPYPEKPERGEPNDSDPAYLAALGEYNAALGVVFLEQLIRYGAEYALTEADRAWVAEVRAGGELDLPADDTHLVISRRLVQTDADLLALQSAILSYAQPTEAEVAAATATFRA